LLIDHGSSQERAYKTARPCDESTKEITRCKTDGASLQSPPIAARGSAQWKCGSMARGNHPQKRGGIVVTKSISTGPNPNIINQDRIKTDMPLQKFWISRSDSLPEFSAQHFLESIVFGSEDHLRNLSEKFLASYSPIFPEFANVAPNFWRMIFSDA
jgi:hypothetical protein